MRNDVIDKIPKSEDNHSNIIDGAFTDSFMRLFLGIIIGGVSGAIEEDEPFSDGAFKDGLIWLCVCWYLWQYWRNVGEKQD